VNFPSPHPNKLLEKLYKYILQDEQHGQYIHANTDFFEITADEVDEYVTEYSQGDPFCNAVC